MLKYFIFLMTLIISSAAFAKLDIDKLKCQADLGGTKTMAVPVVRSIGIPDKKIDYLGNKIAVGFDPGGTYETQQVFTIEINGYKSTIIDPEKSLYWLEAPGAIRIQCWSEQ